MVDERKGKKERTENMRPLHTPNHPPFPSPTIQQAAPALEGKAPVEIDLPVTNLNRTVGTMLSYHISKRHGRDGLPEDTIKIKLRGRF
jgi:glutamate synthase domain-containing protein 3